MTHNPLVTSLAAVALAALCAFTPVSAKDKDDKKPATPAPAPNEEYRLGAGDKALFPFTEPRTHGHSSLLILFLSRGLGVTGHSGDVMTTQSH